MSDYTPGSVWQRHLVFSFSESDSDELLSAGHLQATATGAAEPPMTGSPDPPTNGNTDPPTNGTTGPLTTSNTDPLTNDTTDPPMTNNTDPLTTSGSGRDPSSDIFRYIPEPGSAGDTQPYQRTINVDLHPSTPGTLLEVRISGSTDDQPRAGTLSSERARSTSDVDPPHSTSNVDPPRRTSNVNPRRRTSNVNPARRVSHPYASRAYAPRSTASLLNRPEFVAIAFNGDSAAGNPATAGNSAAGDTPPSHIILIPTRGRTPRPHTLIQEAPPAMTPEAINALRARYPDAENVVGTMLVFGRLKYVVKWKRNSPNEPINADTVDAHIAGLLWPELLIRYLIRRDQKLLASGRL